MLLPCSNYNTIIHIVLTRDMTYRIYVALL
jgi:hypothetical protein